MFRWAMSRDDLKYSPVDGVEAPRPLRPRTRFLSNIELAAAWRSSFDFENAYGSLFRLLILTGQRRGEVAGLQWSELDRNCATWRLPAERSKNRRAHLVSLSHAAIAELDSIADGNSWPETGLVLRSSCCTALSAFSKAKVEWDHRIEKMLSSCGSTFMADWRLHDIRRSVATGMQALQIRTEIIEAVLNHQCGTRDGIVSVYQRYDYEVEKRLALNLWAEHIAKLHTDLDAQMSATSLTPTSRSTSENVITR
jgi:integrase